MRRRWQRRIHACRRFTTRRHAREPGGLRLAFPLLAQRTPWARLPTPAHHGSLVTMYLFHMFAIVVRNRQCFPSFNVAPGDDCERLGDAAIWRTRMVHISCQRPWNEPLIAIESQPVADRLFWHLVVGHDEAWGQFLRRDRPAARTRCLILTQEISACSRVHVPSPVRLSNSSRTRQV